jgi:hypothetical protein
MATPSQGQPTTTAPEDHPALPPLSPEVWGAGIAGSQTTLPKGDTKQKGRSIMTTMTTTETQVSQFPTPPEGACFAVTDITNINHKPHPYMIGPRHVGHASDNFGGRLSADAIEDGEKKGIHCAHRGCTVSYHNHTSDRVAVITVSDPQDRDLQKMPGLGEYLSDCVATMMELKIEGFVFVKGEKA